MSSNRAGERLTPTVNIQQPGRPTSPPNADASNKVCALGRESTGNWEIASRREWLVTNGIGGYASGTVSGANTRRYHGLLVASLSPPVQRVVALSKAEISVEYLGKRYDLSSNEYSRGVINPVGYVHIESFRIDRGIPIWRFAFADAVLEQRVFMAPGLNTCYLLLHIESASADVHVFITPLCTYRDYHSYSRGAQPYTVEASASSCNVKAFEAARILRLSVDGGTFEQSSEWYWNFFHREESERGLDASEDLFKPGRFRVILRRAQSAYLKSSLESEVRCPSATTVLAKLWRAASEAENCLPATSPDWIRQLSHAANQFLVSRGVGNTRGSSVIAGYPWFADWGRDTMIALPGLTSSLGRHAASADILRTFAKFVDRGMLPNRFPDAGESPEYNTVDATLWYFHAVNESMKGWNSSALGQELYPTLLSIIRAHIDGTRFGIQVDPKDSLLRAGIPGEQLTWMDAKIGDWVITPRVGKPVEVNSLWLNALQVTWNLANQCRDPAGRRLCADLLERGTIGFGKFWNESRGCLYDVLDVDGSIESDSSLRPNQIFAVSLPLSPLSADQRRSIVTICGRELLTSVGLRSLAPGEAAYRSRYEGDPRSRDSAYHQGTVWPWLLGPFALAHYRVYDDAEAAQALLAPIGLHLRDACIGSVSEVLDAEPPHAARGCFAQAWSVAEILRTWLVLESARLAKVKTP